MRIALVNMGRVNNAYGGTEKVFFDMANNLSRRGHEVVAIVHDTHQGSPVFPIDEAVEYHNCKVSMARNFWIQVHRRVAPLFVDKKDRTKRKIQCKYFPRAVQIKKLLERIPPVDIFISFQALATYLLLDVLKVKQPVITMNHTLPSYEGDENALFKEALKKSACLQVLMPEYIDIVKKSFPEADVIAIPNIVPQFSESSSLEKPIIINVGRISKSIKRQWLIVEAFSKIAEKYPEWSVELWGEKNEHPKDSLYLEALIRHSGLQGRVKLCGSTRDVPSVLKEGAIFCFPSAYEGMPLAMTEAMSMGLPVIGCKECSSVNSIIQHGENGFLCNSSDDDISQKLDVLMSDFELRKKMGAQAKIDMVKYSPDVVWQMWDDLIASKVKSSQCESL